MKRLNPTLAALMLSWIVASVAAAGDSEPPPECPVSLVLDSDRYGSSHDVKVRLVFDGVDTIFLPLWLPRSVRVTRLEAPPVYDAPPRLSRLPAKTIRPLKAVPYSLADPWPLDIRWLDVARWNDDGTFEVTAGLYRLHFVYAPTEPDKKDDDVRLCTTYSDVFTLDSDGKWRYLTE